MPSGRHDVKETAARRVLVVLVFGVGVGVDVDLDGDVDLDAHPLTPHACDMGGTGSPLTGRRIDRGILRSP